MNTSVTPTPLTLRDVVRRAVVTALAAVAIILAALGSVVALTDQWTLDLSSGSVPDERSTMPGDTSDAVMGADARTAALVEQHHCWSTAADTPPDMRGEIPGHVVVTTVVSAPDAVYSADLVAAALDQVVRPGMTTPGADLVVHAFCR